MKLLNERYKDFIPGNDIDNFVKDISTLKNTLNFDIINTLNPLLIYTQNKRNQLYYLLSINYSLQKSKILNHVVVTGQTFIREHFADNDRDKDLYDKIYYGDLTFISLSQSDYTSEYLENLLIDLVDFRKRLNKLTVITYDLINAPNYKVQTKKLSDFFSGNKYNTIDLSKVTSEHSVKATRVKKGTGGRIV